MCIRDRDQGVGIVASGAAGGGAQPGDELVDVEGLGDVVVGAGLERVHLVAAAGAAGQHDDRRPGVAPHGPDDVHAVEVGQPEVEHNDVRGPAGRGVQGGGAVLGDACLLYTSAAADDL